jgi:hypothetical protein
VVRAGVRIPYKVGHLKSTTNRQKRTWSNSFDNLSRDRPSTWEGEAFLRPPLPTAG